MVAIQGLSLLFSGKLLVLIYKQQEEKVSVVRMGLKWREMYVQRWIEMFSQRMICFFSQNSDSCFQIRRLNICEKSRSLAKTQNANQRMVFLSICFDYHGRRWSLMIMGNGRCIRLLALYKVLKAWKNFLPVGWSFLLFLKLNISSNDINCQRLLRFFRKHPYFILNNRIN